MESSWKLNFPMHINPFVDGGKYFCQTFKTSVKYAYLVIGQLIGELEIGELAIGQ